MKGLRNFDLYKAIIFASVGLLPVVGGWAYWLSGQLDEAQAAVAAAKKQGGDLEEIGKWMKGIEEQQKVNLNQQDAQEVSEVYFQRRILEGLRNANSPGALKSSDFTVTEGAPVPAGKGALDRLVEVKFRRGGKDAFPLRRDFLLAVLFNSEARSQAWKLRELKARNATLSDRAHQGKAPPAETGDEWFVEKLVFASRIPDTRGR